MSHLSLSFSLFFRLYLWWRCAPWRQYLVCVQQSLHVLHVCEWSDHLLGGPLSVHLSKPDQRAGRMLPSVCRYSYNPYKPFCACIVSSLWKSPVWNVCFSSVRLCVWRPCVRPWREFPPLWWPLSDLHLWGTAHHNMMCACVGFLTLRVCVCWRWCQMGNSTCAVTGSSARVWWTVLNTTSYTAAQTPAALSVHVSMNTAVSRCFTFLC